MADGARAWFAERLARAVPPAEQTEGEPAAFVDGLRLRIAFVARVAEIPDDLWPPASEAIDRGEAGLALRCPPGVGRARRACVEGWRWGREIDWQTNASEEHLRGRDAFLHEAYRASVLAEFRACRQRRGRVRPEGGLTTWTDANADGIFDVVVDFRRLSSSAGPGPACAGAAGRLDLHLSGRDGHRLGHGGQVARWPLRLGRPSLLEVEPAACAGRAGCREVWRIEGDRTFPGAR